MQESATCPVAQTSSSAATGSGCPVDHTKLKAGQMADKFPVDPVYSSNGSDTAPNDALRAGSSLSTARQTSSIPRPGNQNWVYPSEAQFFAAMARKNHNPQASDMKVIVPIHNAVNERTWTEVLKWEDGRGGEKCGGIKLVSFKGRSKDLSPKARWRSLLGYAPPFDRHDWVIDRCGTHTRYIIDYYTGRSFGPGPDSPPSFFLDVRPALDSWEGVKMRVERFWGRWLGNLLRDSPSSAQSS